MVSKIVTSRQKGFSLGELLIVLVIVGLMCALASPHVSEMRNIISKNSAEMQLQQHLRWLQAKAVEQGCQATIVLNSTSTRYSMGCDYIPFQDTEQPSIETELASHSLPSHITLQLSAPLIFNTRGQSINSEGNLQEVEIDLRLHGQVYNTAVVRPTGFFELH